MKIRAKMGLVYGVLCTVVALLLAACDMSGAPQPSATTVSVEPTASQTTAQVSPTRAAQIRTPQRTRTARATAVATTRPTSAANMGTTPTPTVLPSARRAEIFDDVWETVRDKYLYSDYHGADWDGLRDEYRPRVLNATTSTDFYTLLAEMVEKLGDEHSRYISPQEVQEEEELQRGDATYAGIGVMTTYEEDAALVILVFHDSPAEERGLQRRDRITHVDGQPFNAESSNIRGPEGTAVRLTVQSPGREPRDVTITRRAVKGKITASSSRLEADPGVGYLIVPSLWADDMADQVRSELNELRSQKPSLTGIVMDLRANEGGWRPVLTGILGEFVEGQVGVFYSQEREDPLRISSGDLYEDLREIPLVVLVDGDSQSYAEVLAGALQASGRAKVVGIKTAGNTETIYPYTFSDGSRLWVAEEGYKLPDDTNMEGRGVIPDTEIDVKWTEYSEREDPHIVEALRLLREP